MGTRFNSYLENLHSQVELLLVMPPATPMTLPKAMCKRGVYLLSEGDVHLYVGRSNGLKKGIGRHCRPGATHRMAALAFRLAREATGNLKATYNEVDHANEHASEMALFLVRKIKITMEESGPVAEGGEPEIKRP
jgi:hypothetical protein